MRAFLRTTLHADGCSTVEAQDGQELLELLESSLDGPELRPDVIVADVVMPGLSGLEALAALQHSRWNLPVILITVLTDDSLHVVARRLGAVGVLHKPFDPDDLLTAVHNATAVQRLHA